MQQYEENFYHKIVSEIKNWEGGKEAVEKFKWGHFVPFAPDIFLLLIHMKYDESVSDIHRSRIETGIQYFLNPDDYLPENVLGPLGYYDDLVVAAYVLMDVVTESGTTSLITHWNRQEDIIDLLKNILGNAEAMLGKGLWSKIRMRL